MFFRYKNDYTIKWQIPNTQKNDYTIRICYFGGEKSKITFGGQTQVQMGLPVT